MGERQEPTITEDVVSGEITMIGVVDIADAQGMPMKHSKERTELRPGPVYAGSTYEVRPSTDHA